MVGIKREIREIKKKKLFRQKDNKFNDHKKTQINKSLRFLIRLDDNYANVNLVLYQYVVGVQTFST